jgi:hypothetical protein
MDSVALTFKLAENHLERMFPFGINPPKQAFPESAQLSCLSLNKACSKELGARDLQMLLLQ